MRNLTIIVVLALTGCGAAVPAKPEIVRLTTTEYVAVPADFTTATPIPGELVPGDKNRDLKEREDALEAALKACNADKAAIRDLKPPSTNEESSDER